MFCSPVHQGRMQFQGFPLLLLWCVLCTLGSSTQCWCDSKYVSPNYALKVCGKAYWVDPWTQGSYSDPGPNLLPVSHQSPI